MFNRQLSADAASQRTFHERGRERKVGDSINLLASAVLLLILCGVAIVLRRSEGAAISPVSWECRVPLLAGPLAVRTVAVVFPPEP